MTTRMLVHDTRLTGTAPRIAQNIYRVDQTTSLHHAINWIASYATAQRGLDRLLVMCHGMTGGIYDGSGRVCTVDLGFGLLFCRDNLTLANVSLTARLKGLVQEIILFACGPARTRPGAQNTRADGRRFCAELAAHTNASVVAATETQYYTVTPPANLLLRLLRIGPQDTIDFGAWEGPVIRVSPNGSMRPANL